MYSNEYQHIHLMNYSRFHARANRQPLDLGFGIFLFFWIHCKAYTSGGCVERSNFFMQRYVSRIKMEKLLYRIRFQILCAKPENVLPVFFSYLFQQHKTFRRKKSADVNMFVMRKKKQTGSKSKDTFRIFFFLSDATLMKGEPHVVLVVNQFCL